MTHVDVLAGVFCRFDLDRLCITPELVGAKHKFFFEGLQFTVQLPAVVDREDVPFELRRLHLHKWQTKGNVPLEYEVHNLDVEVALVDSVRVPEEILRLHPNQFDLIPPNEQTRLNKLVAEGEQALRSAFSYWLRVLRWKSGIGYIGEPSVRHAGSDRSGAVLRERVTKHRMWLQGGVIAVTSSQPVALEAWNTQAALSACKSPPVWFEFLFDSQMRINNKDLVGGVLSLAIALEVNLRFIFSEDLLKAKLQPVLLEVFDLANMRALLTRLKKIRQWDSSWAASTDLSAFHRLMDYRDGVMHRAKTENLDESELRQMHKAVKAFAYFTCDALGLS